MTAVATEKNLLFGLLALQNGLIDQGRLVAAFQAWALEKSRLIADHLVASGDLDIDQRTLLDAMVAMHLKKHGGDVEKSLAAVPVGQSTRESLFHLGDAAVSATIAHVGSGHHSTEEGDRDPDRTGTYFVGIATSDGQRFRVLRPHAHGGLGAVFVALDCELHREVALKQILDRHADDPSSRQRFLLEAEVTGGLEHPGIVPVYGLGTYADGRPFYAMRFIRGNSMKEAIEQFHGSEESRSASGTRSLELRKLLRRFLDVCNAIEYAHSRGVLHRDIKPANIIVGKHGETLVVDWGLAKVTGKSDPGSGERTLTTRSGGGSSETLPGSALGTPAYMSPEQAHGDLENLGPRSDVYSLGSTLYSLLTGKPPVQGDDVGAMLRAVQEGAIPAPRQLDTSIDKALEAVCQKAMALRPEDRYGTPRALAEDIERWMADEPVTAVHDPLIERARRWARQRKTTVATLAAALLMALVGLAGMLAVQAHAKGALQKSNIQLAGAIERESKANLALRQANARTESRFALAMEAIQVFHSGVSSDLLLKQTEFGDLRTRLLRGAKTFYDKLETLLKDQSDASSRMALGAAYHELGRLTREIGSADEALAVLRKSLGEWRELASQPGAGLQVMRELASCLMTFGRIQDATGRIEEARTANLEARSILESLTSNEPESADDHAMLAATYKREADSLARTGQIAGALKALEKSRSILEAAAKLNPGDSSLRFQFAVAAMGAGDLQIQIGEMQEALKNSERSVALLEKLAREKADEIEYQRTLALAYISVGSIKARTARTQEGLDAYELARDRLEPVSRANPALLAVRSELAMIYHNIADCLRNLGRIDDCLVANQRGLTLRDALLKASPSVVQYHRDVGSSLNDRGVILYHDHRPVEALAVFERARVVRERLAHEYPSVIQYQNELGRTESNVLATLADLGRVAEALAMAKRNLEARERLAAANPKITRIQSDLAIGYHNLSAQFVRRRRWDEALALSRKALEIREKLGRDNPTDDLYQADLAFGQWMTADLLDKTGSEAQATAGLERARDLYEALARKNPTAVDSRRNLAQVLDVIADRHMQGGRNRKNLENRQKARAIRAEIVKGHPENPVYQEELASTTMNLGMLAAQEGDVSAATRSFRECLADLGRIRDPRGSMLYLMAQLHAQLSLYLGRTREGPSNDPSDAPRAHQDAAIALLRQVAGRKDHVLSALHADPALDPLRARPDFQLFEMDVAFPDQPIAPGN